MTFLFELSPEILNWKKSSIRIILTCPFLNSLFSDRGSSSKCEELGQDDEDVFNDKDRVGKKERTNDREWFNENERYNAREPYSDRELYNDTEWSTEVWCNDRERPHERWEQYCHQDSWSTASLSELDDVNVRRVSDISHIQQLRSEVPGLSHLASRFYKAGTLITINIVT